MEFLTVLLSSLLGLFTPAGLVVDRTALNAIRSQLTQADQLHVRVDNAPTHQLLQGKVARVRIAGRGMRFKWQNIRIALFEMESDAIELDTRSLSRSRPKLKKPLQAGVRLVFTQDDLNQALRSPELIAKLEKLTINSDDDANTGSNPVYKFANPRVKFLPNERLRIQVELQEEGNKKPLAIAVESGLNTVAGKQIQLINPVVDLNGEIVPPRIVNAFVENISDRLNLSELEQYGLQLRILKLKMKPEKFEMAVFLRVEPSAKILETRRS